MGSRALVVAVLGPLFVSFACGGSDSGAATSDSFADQYCAVFSPCCAQQNRPTDGATCKAFVSAAASGKTYDAAKGSTCLDQVKVGSAKPDFCQTLDIEAPACSEVYAATGGTVQPGSPCKEDTDCAPAADGKAECVSTPSSGTETRICQIQVTGKEGDTPCVGTKDGSSTSFTFTSSGTGGTPVTPSRGFLCNVADGLRCESKEKKCVRISDVGGPCDGSSNACVKTAYCDGTQTCAPRVTVGSPCGANGVSSSACVAEAYCDTTEKKCLATTPIGAACAKNEQCVSRRCLNGTCDSSAGSSFSLAFLCGGG